MQLIRVKQKKCNAAKQSGDYSAYIALRKTIGAAIRSHHRNLESRFICNNNHRAFFSHVSKRLNNNDRQIHLEVNGAIISDSIAAETFLSEFSSNFSVATSSCVDYSMGNKSSFMPYCTELLVMEVLIKCPSSNSSSDVVHIIY